MDVGVSTDRVVVTMVDPREFVVVIVTSFEEMDVGVSVDIVVVIMVDPRELVVVTVTSVNGYSVA